jgi:cell division protein FtsZ
MVDDKLDDQVWVTVVATGYGAQAALPQLREPAGEPRVKRTNPGREGRTQRAQASRDIGQRRGGLAVSDRDVPEFIPNF